MTPLGALLPTENWSSTSFLQGFDLPTPTLYAIFHPGGRFLGSVPCFTQAHTLADYLRRDIPYPFFAKPVHASHGRGAAAVKAYDRDSDRLLFANDTEVAMGRVDVRRVPRP